jgi:hypothetical protein
MLIRSSQWIKDNFACGSEPHPKTIKNWIEAGELEGEIIGHLVYVESTALAIRKANPKAVRDAARKPVKSVYPFIM